MYKLIKMFLNTLVFIMSSALIFIAGHFISKFLIWQLGDPELITRVEFTNINDYFELFTIPARSFWNHIFYEVAPSVAYTDGANIFGNIGTAFKNFWLFIWHYISSVKHIIMPLSTYIERYNEYNPDVVLEDANKLGVLIGYIVTFISLFTGLVFVYNNRVEVYNPNSGIGINSGLAPMPGTRRAKLPKIKFKRREKRRKKSKYNKLEE